MESPPVCIAYAVNALLLIWAEFKVHITYLTTIQTIPHTMAITIPAAA
jgi:hypothetical protein